MALKPPPEPAFTEESAELRRAIRELGGSDDLQQAMDNVCRQPGGLDRLRARLGPQEQVGRALLLAFG